MSEMRPPWGRWGSATGLFIPLLLTSASMLEAQDLPLKRDLPGTDSIACPELDPALPPDPEAAEQASRLGSDADQALILGDQERVRDLLARATELDPTSAELAYRYGRSLESLGETEAAIEEFCRALALGSREQGIGDARPRLEALARAREPDIPEAARSAFLNGLLQADLGDLEGAEAAFGEAFLAAPEWPAALYNRGVVRMRLDKPDLAVEDLEGYLDLHPNAADAILVSQRIGQLQTRPSAPVSAGAALGLGLVLPGMGQFYSGRALGGFSVLALAGGALATGFLVEKVEVRCVGGAPSGGDCPPDRIISEDTSKPYQTAGLVAAGVVTLIGAVEAYLNVGGDQDEPDEEGMALSLGEARLSGPSVTARGPRLQISVMKVSF